MKDFFINNNITYKENVSFKELTSYKVGGNIKYIVYPSTDNIKLLIDYLNSNNIKYYILGNGTNILPSSKEYDGVIIKLDLFNEIEKHENYILVGGGYNLSKLCIPLIKDNYKYYSGLATIPGTVGGTIIMNAGAYGTEIEDVIIEALVYINGEVKIIKKEDMNLTYRDSIFKKDNYIILTAKFKLIKSEDDELEIFESNRNKRTSSQPIDKLNAGSIFKNPTNDSAGRLIESCGLKGYKIGGAEVSEKHANFIINDGSATSEDIYNLIMYVKKIVKEKYGIDLETEVKLFNF